ncbi:MAG TPA: chromate transporter, partial [Tepidisphaeraceae bacterium]|nr:chromate transporter [Tepidisphaeraceae bacterium]
MHTVRDDVIPDEQRVAEVSGGECAPLAGARPSLGRVFGLFLKLGATAFGGLAMVTYIRDQTVRKRRWVSEQSFQDGVALFQSLPGATVMQVAAYVGLRTRGVFGA